MFELLIGLGFAVILVALYRVYKQRNDAWAKAARLLDLDFERGGIMSAGRLTGAYNGVRVDVRSVERGGKNKQVFTVFSASAGPLAPSGLELAPEGVVSTIGEMFGMEDIDVGHQRLDGAFVIKGEEPDEVRQFLDKRHVRYALLELHDTYEESFSLEEGRLKIMERGFEDDPAAIQRQLEMLTETVQRINSEPPERSGAPHEPARQQERTETNAGSDGNREDWW